jgi:hypothetical protein
VCEEEKMYRELFNTILEDHNQIRDTMERLLGMQGEPSIKKKALFAELEFQLVPHMKAEEKVYYAAMLDKHNTREDAFKAIEEHRVAETMLGELKHTPVEDEFWEPRMKVLRELVTAHMDNEEKDYFQDTMNYFAEDEVSEIYDKYRVEKGKVQATLP